MFDKTIEDDEIERLCEERLRTEPMAKICRDAKKAIRQRLEEHFADAINLQGENDGWVRVGRHRLRAVATERKEGSVKIGAGINFKLEIEEI